MMFCFFFGVLFEGSPYKLGRIAISPVQLPSACSPISTRFRPRGSNRSMHSILFVTPSHVSAVPHAARWGRFVLWGSCFRPTRGSPGRWIGSVSRASRLSAIKSVCVCAVRRVPPGSSGDLHLVPVGPLQLLHAGCVPLGVGHHGHPHLWPVHWLQDWRLRLLSA